MRKIIALPGQSILDISLLHCGDMIFSWVIARLNSIPLTTTFEQYGEIVIPDDRNYIARRFEEQGIVFATGIIEAIPLDLPWLLSSGYWDDTANWNDVAVWND